MKLFKLAGLGCALAALSLLPVTSSRAEAAICIPQCDYTFPTVTVTYTGLGDTCQLAQANLDAQISTYATGFCDPYRPCGVYTVITQNCWYNSNLRKWQMKGYGTFSCTYNCP